MLRNAQTSVAPDNFQLAFLSFFSHFCLEVENEYMFSLGTVSMFFKKYN